ncbi:hypothetical protein ACC720_39750, partial [Rhizobium ruizarguesonis]
VLSASEKTRGALAGASSRGNLCICVAAAGYFGWLQFGAYQQRQQDRDFADIDRERRVALLEIDGCQAQVDMLLSMT